MNNKTSFLKIYELLSLIKNDEIKFFSLIPLLIISSILEMISLGMVLPFIQLIFNFENALSKTPSVFKNLIINYKDLSQIDAIIIFSIFFFIFLFLSLFLRARTLKLSLEISNKTSTVIGKNLYNRVFDQSYINFLLTPSSQILSSIAQKIDDCSLSIFSFLNFISNLIFTVAIISMLVILLPVIFILILIPILLFFFIIFFFIRKKLSINSVIINTNRDILVENTQSSLNLFKEITINNAIKKFSKKFQNSISTIYGKKFINAYLSSVPRIYIEGIAYIFLFIIIYLSFLVIDDFNLIITNLAICVFGAQKLLPVLNQVFVSNSFIASKSDSIVTIIKYLKLPKDEISTIKSNKNFSIKKITSIKIKDLTFKYPNSPVIFQDVNLEINKVKNIGIIGRSGAGKSTLIDIISGFLNQKKNIYVNDIDLYDLDIHSFRDRISLVTQYVYLENDTIFNNICSFSSDKNNKERAIECLKIAQLFEFVDSLNKGIDEVLGGKDGIFLSGGQKQRLSIARALYKDFDVLVLDEPTNALDQETENKIFESIFKLNKIVILITHNLELMSKCDLIYQIKNKKIIKLEKKRQTNQLDSF